MIKAEAKKRIQKLRTVIDHHRYLYHVLDEQKISDEAHDSLKHELARLETQYPDLITAGSPTQRVGGQALEKFGKIEHTVPMLSIEDIFADTELEDWETYLLRLKSKKPEYFAEVKVDGFAVSLLYRDGVFATGATRGDGEIGEDVTQNLKTIESIPLHLEVRGTMKEKKIAERVQRRIMKGEIEVRGEVYMTKADFKKFNKQRKKKGEEEYANPRNLAVGSIRQLNPALAASRPLHFIAYDVVTELGQTTHAQEHDILKMIGFKADNTAIVCLNIQSVQRYWRSTEKKRDSFPFHIDGVVVSVNRNMEFESYGIAGKGQRGMRALKFAGKQATTKVLGVKFQVGRTGVITPVAVLEPVQLAGVTVSRATLHNEDEIRRLGVKIGDTVIVERAGDVIPAVVQTLSDLRSGKEKTIRIPKSCPSCGTRLHRSVGEAAWKCGNKGCRAQHKESLYHFVSRKALDIEGLGPKIIDQLVKEHLVIEYADLFRLKKEDLEPLERFAEKSAENIIANIQERKVIPFHRFLYALGIHHVGEETVLDLVAHFGSIEKLQKASQEELEQIPDIGKIVAVSIYEWFRSKENKKLITDLIAVGVKIENPKRLITSQVFQGQTFVLTGGLESLTRDEVKTKIRSAGGNIAGSVSSKTDFVIAGESPGSKLAKAQKLELRILTEKQFLRLLRENK